MRRSVAARAFIIGVFLVSMALRSQVTLMPTFATQNDTVEVIFDASQGNAALVGVSPVYAHTGVITNLSGSLAGWRHVQGNWGQADPKVEMTDLGNNLHSIKYHINSFYGVPANETVSHLAFVFRNADGSIVGRTATGGDIYASISQGGFQALIQQPSTFMIYGSSDTVSIVAQTSANADLDIFLNGAPLIQAIDTNEISFELELSAYSADRYEIVFRAVDQGVFYYDTVPFVLRTGPKIAFDTASYEEGLTILNDSTIALKLRAPFKDYTYVIGDFNNWEVSPEYEMFKSPDGKFYWQLITGLDPNTEYAFQYYVGGEEALRIADPYAEKILDPWNDRFIPQSVYPNLKPYPTGKTLNRVGTFIINKPQYQWQNDNNYTRPASEELVVYELLIRDFGYLNTLVPKETYKHVIERLDYLDSLGVNAIELMPIMEFEGNNSWGYDPIFFMAADKYYGTEEDLKALIDSAHGRGMAVLFDIAMNHAFGGCPLVQLYFDASAGQYGQPTAQSPWFNEVPKHDFNVGYDFNHNSDATKYFVKRVFQHWVKEFHIDGYRVDLSKGFTQKNTLGDVAALAQYDQGRINILQRIKNDVEEVDSNAIMILEHFADGNEEQELASRGFLLWGNENHQYSEASMGYTSNLSGIYHGNRGFNTPALVGYMESHDEERLMYKNMEFGNSSGGYSTKDLATSLDRVELAAAFFFTVPGPKMIWQFGELGYDYSINHCPDGTIDPNCRLAPKPVRWDYLREQDRSDLYLQFGNLISLRKSYPNVFQTSDVTPNLGSMLKVLQLKTNDSNAVVIGNFNVIPMSVSEQFPHNGWWYDFNSGDSTLINGDYDSTFAPGQYQIWLDFKTQREYNNVDLVELQKEEPTISVYPNPVTASSFIEWSGKMPKELQLQVWSPDGRKLAFKRYYSVDLASNRMSIGELVSELPQGVYFLELTSGESKSVIPFVAP